jgi:predicted Rdx family selenoprotein
VAELNGLGHVVEMAGGEKSQFDVLADGELVYSKQQTGSFPELADLVAILPSPGG